MNSAELLKASIAVLAAPEQSARACRNCDTEIGREVAAEVFSDNFTLNALLTPLLLATLLIIVWFIHYARPGCMPSAQSPLRNFDVKNLAVNLELNMFRQGLFHTFIWIMNALGVAMRWNAVRQRDVALSTKTFVDPLALEWGLSNLVEGTIDYRILHAHHGAETSKHRLWELVFV